MRKRRTQNGERRKEKTATIKQHRGGFWLKLKKPFFALAPMANVTDYAMRQMIAKYGKPAVMWTEFVSADGLASLGKKRLLIDLKYSDNERPIVAQLFTSNPEKMEVAAGIVKKLGFDGLDINMGCPDRKVEKQGGGAAMIRTPELAIEVLKAAKEGVRRTEKGEGRREKTNIPVSIKTRIGYNSIDLNWIKLLLEQRLPALTVHLRTRKEMSKVKAHWELMPEIVKMRDQISPETLIIGNGDVESVQQGLEYMKKYGCDGIMIGRGIFGQPWVFKSAKNKTLKNEPSLHKKLKILVEHAKLFEKTFKRKKSFDVMKKHFKAYVNGFDGAKELRAQLMEASSSKEVAKVVKIFLIDCGCEN